MGSRKKSVDDFFKDIPYHYYYGHKNCFKEALKKERAYVLNCSDYPKDLSPEATNRRFKMFLRQCKEEKKP